MVVANIFRTGEYVEDDDRVAVCKILAKSMIE